MDSITKKAEENRNFLKNKVNVILEPLLRELLMHKPENVHRAMVEFIRNDKHNPGKAYEDMMKMDKIPDLEARNDSFDSQEDEDEIVDDLTADQIRGKVSKNPRGSISAEVYGKFNKKEDFKPREIPKSGSQKKNILQRLSQSFMFEALDDTERDIVINAMEIVEFKSGETVINQGEDGDLLYVVGEGTLDCYKVLKKGEQAKYMKQYSPGDAFGELALLYNAPRAASIVAKTDCVLFALDRPTFNNIVKEAEFKRRQRYEDILEKIDVLKSMDPYDRMMLTEGFSMKQFSKGQTIFNEGEAGSLFYFVEKGVATAMKGNRAVTDHQVGDYFGEVALLFDKPQPVTMVAGSDVSLLSLDSEKFHRLLKPIKGILEEKGQNRYDYY